MLYTNIIIILEYYLCSSTVHVLYVVLQALLPCGVGSKMPPDLQKKIKKAYTQITCSTFNLLSLH